MNSLWNKFWRAVLLKVFSWQTRGSLDAYPQRIHVIIGPIDGMRERLIVWIWRQGWKNARTGKVQLHSSAMLTEEALYTDMDRVPAGDWTTLVGVDADRRMINVHSPFRRSAHPERDAAYAARYFAYHTKEDGTLI